MALTDHWDTWKQTQVERVLATPPGEPVAPLEPQPGAILPPDEELVAEAPGDILGRYVLLLARWSALLARQAAHNVAAAQVNATAQELRTAWQALRREYDACRTTVDTLDVPLESVLTVHLAQLGTPSPLSDTPLPRLLQQCLAAQPKKGV